MTALELQLAELKQELAHDEANLEFYKKTKDAREAATAEKIAKLKEGIARIENPVAE